MGVYSFILPFSTPVQGADVGVNVPKTVLVGLPEAAVRESIHRIERALVNRGSSRPPGGPSSISPRPGSAAKVAVRGDRPRLPLQGLEDAPGQDAPVLAGRPRLPVLEV